MKLHVPDTQDSAVSIIVHYNDAGIMLISSKCIYETDKILADIIIIIISQEERKPATPPSP